MLKALVELHSLVMAISNSKIATEVVIDKIVESKIRNIYPYASARLIHFFTNYVMGKIAPAANKTAFINLMLSNW